jgi:hypothetical protein
MGLEEVGLIELWAASPKCHVIIRFAQQAPALLARIPFMCNSCVCAHAHKQTHTHTHT